jgi:hypothetical protein
MAELFGPSPAQLRERTRQHLPEAMLRRVRVTASC